MKYFTSSGAIRALSTVVVSLFVWGAAANAAAVCATDDECQDGIFCNGREQCDPGHDEADSSGCIDGAFPCPRGPGLYNCLEGPRTCEEICPDADGDGHHDPSCGGDDCDDSDASRFPGNTEVCDSGVHDEDCDPQTFGSKDADRDGFVDSNCCNIDINAGGTAICGRDCDDARSTVHPTAPEVCNGLDNDCDGTVDDGVEISVYPDSDGDGHGAAGSAAIRACSAGPGLSTRNNDCNDSNAAIQPGALVCGPKPGEALLCDSTGNFVSTNCRKCVTQPNGTGVCRAPTQ